MNLTKIIVSTFLLLLVLQACNSSSKKADDAASNYVSFVQNDSLNKLEVFIDNKYFTSYLYADSTLRKPVLFPINTASGKRITRGYPIAPNKGERIDHPHHYGLWFNHGIVNDIDFWNSDAVPWKPNMRYGRINHVKFLKIEDGEKGILEVEKEWRSDINELILIEQTRYIFSGDAKTRTITHISSLTAPEVDVFFEDSKEGMFAMRVRRELEIASDKPAVLYGNDEKTAEKAVVDNKNVSGHYRNSNGLEGYPAVWGKRAKWMQLAGKIDNDSISICMFDHPSNLNHPPHWMARDYGLYGINPLGSNVYTNGKEQFNYTLKKGETVKFTHQVVIINGVNPKTQLIDSLYNNFAANLD
ncbi:MAG: PmoA family protein [Prolixibacteraceae bacterium]|jgi:hypothetical protein|nr:PmoA family protein [Prolixibacteraceae bacterium]